MPMMKNRQMLYLFFCNFAVFITGGALLPLLPLYATELGGTPTVVGFYLAAMYFAIAVGTMLPGWLVRRVSRKRLFLTAGVTGVPVLVLHAQVSQLWQAIPLTMVVWFCGGIGTALVSVLIGLHADTHHRGRSFGLMFLARPLGGVMGSLLAGQLVEWWSYPLLFVTLSMIWAGWPVIGLLILKDEPGPSVPTRADRVVHKVSGQVDSAFYLLVLAAFLSTTVVYTGRLGVSLSMQMLSFSPRAVAATSAVGALITIPIVLVLGTLSDRLGRKGLLLLSYLLAAAGVVILSIATQFWQFGLTMVLLMAHRLPLPVHVRGRSPGRRKPQHPHRPGLRRSPRYRRHTPEARPGRPRALRLPHPVPVHPRRPHETRLRRSPRSLPGSHILGQCAASVRKYGLRIRKKITWP